MGKSYWEKKWEEGDTKFNQEATNPILREYFPNLGLTNQATVFVPLCGKSIDMIWLLEKDYKIIGVELSPIAIEAFFHENKLPYTVKQMPNFTLYEGENITLYCGDFFYLSKAQLKSVTGVYDRAAFIALPPQIRKQYVKHYKEILSPGSQILLLTINYKSNQDLSPPFSIGAPEVKTDFAPEFRIQLLKEIEKDKPPRKLAENGVEFVTTEIYRLQHH